MADELVQCRFFVKTLDGGLQCRKYGKVISCKWCPTCPKCTARHFLQKAPVRSDVGGYMSEAMVCPICGNRVEMDLRTESDFRRGAVILSGGGEQAPSRSLPPACSVRGCGSRSWDRLKIDGLYVCTQHEGQVKTWKKRKMSQSRYPLLRVGGEFIENPEYDRRRIRKDGVD